MKGHGRRMMVVAAALAACLGAAPAAADVKAGVDAWQAGDYAGAIGHWRPLADKGDADAQYNMGQAYKLGRGVPVDLRLAEQWYERAAHQGHEQAQANLGLILFQNNERRRAMPWIQKAAENGDPRAQYVLGTALFNGDVVSKDWPQAYALMTRAAAQGLPPAADSLREMDQHLSAEDRQRGLALAQQMERGAQTAAVTAPPPHAAQRRAPDTPPSAGGRPPLAPSHSVQRTAPPQVPASPPAQAARPVVPTPQPAPPAGVARAPVTPRRPPPPPPDGGCSSAPSAPTTTPAATGRR